MRKTSVTVSRFERNATSSGLGRPWRAACSSRRRSTSTLATASGLVSSCTVLTPDSRRRFWGCQSLREPVRQCGLDDRAYARHRDLAGVRRSDECTELHEVDDPGHLSPVRRQDASTLAITPDQLLLEPR